MKKLGIPGYLEMAGLVIHRFSVIIPEEFLKQLLRQTVVNFRKNLYQNDRKNN